MRLSKEFGLLLLLILWRLISVIVVRTAHVPDEYWQSLEVAHRLAFGYGYLTWEWTTMIRSYMYPFLISILYRILAKFSLDYMLLLTMLPRVFQAILVAYADYRFYQWTQNKWMLISLCLNPFWYYYCYCYGMFVITPWKFFHTNVLRNVGNTYGIKHWLCNIIIGLFISMIHQRGTLTIMANLRNEITRTNTSLTDTLILTPCHSTPLYSHLHVNISIRFLTCEPNLSNTENYIDEADQFFANATVWLRDNYINNAKVMLPTYVIVFDKVASEISEFLRTYKLIAKEFYTYRSLTVGNYGENILLYKREEGSLRLDKWVPLVSRTRIPDTRCGNDNDSNGTCTSHYRCFETQLSLRSRAIFLEFT
ncbi:GPI mannosyltransferase 3 [Trachymyrmex cornetzi]|uniref:Mannosyltransferase n=1 Tax=Trachymyrmex cornetzi TaxID=471704 RepID=A0A151JQA7_9HYME|nr:GPI mannosyltransferase 3 [Trachymyrmex cornetzi]